MEFFKSRRNRVYLSDGLVYKERAKASDAEYEADRLRCLRTAGVTVPEVVDVRGNSIVMEFIPGETLPDFLTRMEIEPDENTLHDAAIGLCGWLEKFYSAVDYTKTGEIRGDVNGRNFIISNGRVTGVDFEKQSFGPAEEDIGRLIAFIRTYDPAYTDVKRRFSAMFCRDAAPRFEISEKKIEFYYANELREMEIRRKK